MSRLPRCARPVLVLPDQPLQRAHLAAIVSHQRLPAMAEKGVPAIILTPSSPMEGDFEVMFIPPPPRLRRRSLLAALFSRRPAIALPMSPQTASTPDPYASKSSRCPRLLLPLLMLAAFIIVAHLLLHISRSTDSSIAITADEASSFWAPFTTFWSHPLHVDGPGNAPIATIADVMVPAKTATATLSA